MGWYGESKELCPNCKNKNAATQFDNDLNGPLILWCPDCGLTMYCKTKAYVITSSFIDKNIIGKNLDNINIYDDQYKDIEDQNEDIVTGLY